jgi:zinc/manganese transport system substrate-binding protein
MTRRAALLGAALLAAPAFAQARAVDVVAAESVYAGVARQVAGPGARVTAIMTNPDQDPHEYEPTPSAARAVADARIVVLNGAGYDPWMRRLVDAVPVSGRAVIDVARLVHARGNPHLWYDPQAVLAVAQALADALGRADPDDAAGYAQRARAFAQSLAPLQARVAAMRARWHGAPVTATEPVFGLMAEALGLRMLDEPFQLAVMNGTEPPASEVAAFERNLRTHQARVLITNRQTTDAAVQRLLRIAAEAGVPVVGVTETEPNGEGYTQWMLSQLDALDAALARGPAS